MAADLCLAARCDEIARIFQTAGVTDQVLKVAESVPDFYEWRNKDGEALLRLDWSGQGLSGWPVANFFAQPQLQAVLDMRAKSLPTVEVYQGWEVQQIADHDDYVEVTAEQGHAGQAGEWVMEEARRTVRARYLIGADGASFSIPLVLMYFTLYKTK
jgi:2-polyprenyl-6-methoxyphenol hydroxylase-like FAD-dependent oxidoreductase